MYMWNNMPAVHWFQGPAGRVHAADADRMEEERGEGRQGAAREGKELPRPLRPQRQEGTLQWVLDVVTISLT